MQPPHQRVSEAEFESLINSALTRSVQSFSKLAGFAVDNACLPAQYLRIVSLMYYQLDASNIPTGVIEVDFTADALDIVFASLVGLGVTLPLWIFHHDLGKQLTKGLSDHWNDIRRWILFLYHNVITSHNVKMDVRNPCKCAVLEFLGLLRDRILLPWSKSITTDREMMRVICELWFMETRDPLFSSWSPDGNTQRESAVFNACFLIAHEMGTTIDWDNLLSLFYGEPEFIATVALCHLDHEISRTEALDLNCIAWDLHILTVFSFRDDVRLSLMRQGIIKAASEILSIAVDSKWVGDMRVPAARCMVNATVLLRARIEEMDALPFLLQALERDLIPSLLKCETLLPFTDQPQAHRQPAILLGEILVGYTVYRSILHPVARAVDEAVAKRLDARLTKGGELYKAWKKLSDTVAERRKLVRRDIANGHIQTCENNECSKTSHINRFKRCSGCLHAYYCSQACQRHDWRNGKHKQYCTRVHQRSVQANGQMSTVHSKDLKFLDHVILAELKKHYARLSDHPSKLTLVELNLVGGPAQAVFDARGASANPFGTKCACEVYAHARWKQMAEAGREDKRPMVLVRAFVPGGWSRKVVLQAIPLSMLAEEGRGERWRGPAVDRYLFNFIFTCCGSGGNGPKEQKVIK